MLTSLAIGLPAHGDEIAAKAPLKDYLLKGKIQQSAFFEIPADSLAKPKTFQAGVWNKLWQTYSEAGRKAYSKKDYEEAESMYRGAVEQAQKFSPGDRRLGTSLTNLAATLREAGKYQESQAVFLKAIAEKERWLGPSDPSLAGTLKHYANLLRKMGKGTEAKINEEKAETISAIANHKGITIGGRKSEPIQPFSLADDISQEGREPKGRKIGSETNSSHSAFNHRITRICSVVRHEKAGSEPITIIRINALVLAGGIIGGPNGGSGQARAYIGAPQITHYGQSQPPSSYLDAEVLDLASKYGIAADTIEAITAAGGELLEIDGNQLFYICCPINRNHWHVGLAVLMRKMNEPVYLLESEEDGYKLLVKELASL